MEDNTPAQKAGAAFEENATIKLTDRAIEMVRHALAAESRGPECALRVGVVQGGCSGFSYTMSFDDELKPDDTVVEVGGLGSEWSRVRAVDRWGGSMTHGLQARRPGRHTRPPL